MTLGTLCYTQLQSRHCNITGWLPSASVRMEGATGTETKSATRIPTPHIHTHTHTCDGVLYTNYFRERQPVSQPAKGVGHAPALPTKRGQGTRCITHTHTHTHTHTFARSCCAHRAQHGSAYTCLKYGRRHFPCVCAQYAVSAVHRAVAAAAMAGARSQESRAHRHFKYILVSYQAKPSGTPLRRRPETEARSEVHPCSCCVHRSSRLSTFFQG